MIVIEIIQYLIGQYQSVDV